MPAAGASDTAGCGTASDSAVVDPFLSRDPGMMNKNYSPVDRLGPPLKDDPSFMRMQRQATAVSAAAAPPLVLVAFIFPALAGFNFGFDIGSTSGAIQQLRAVPDAAQLDSSPLLQGLLTSGSLFGTVVGTTLSFVVAAPLGRRRELLLASSLYAAGTAIAVLAPAGPSLLTLVFAGRGIYGVGIAFAMHSAPVYIAEIAPASIRGLLISLKEGFIVGGILAGFSASAAVTAYGLHPSFAWRAIWAGPALVSTSELHTQRRGGRAHAQSTRHISRSAARITHRV